MQIKARLALTLLLFLTAGVAQEARADDDELEELLVYERYEQKIPRVLAAEGPGEDRGTVSLGVAMLGPIPTLDLRYVRGIGKRVMVDGAVSTIGVVQRLRLGARYLVFDREDMGALAIRASLMEAHSFAQPVLVAGAGPGVVYSFGDEVRISLGVDLAWSFLSDSFENSLGDGMQIQPTLGVEVPLDDDLELFLEASALTVADADEVYALPVFSAGLGW